MPHEFEISKEVTIHASPEQVWEAITTGPGIDSWFMGRSQVEPREGGRTSLTMGDHTEEATVSAWEPAKRFAYRSDQSPDGTFMAFEFLIEGRGRGSTLLRFVHSGLLGDDWEAEYDALSKGNGMYLRKLAAYLEHFPGRTSTYNLFAPGPRVADKPLAWAKLTSALGLTGEIAEGDPVRLAVEGLPPVEGVVELVDTPTFVCARTSDGLYTLMHGYQDTVVVEYHGFSDDLDTERIERAWQGWLARSFT
jgi:uncharacterized protein YndB with AHSA1/START domain